MNVDATEVVRIVVRSAHVLVNNSDTAMGALDTRSVVCALRLMLHTPHGGGKYVRLAVSVCVALSGARSRGCCTYQIH